MGVLLVLRLRFQHAITVCLIDLTIYFIFLLVRGLTADLAHSLVYYLFVMFYCGLSSWTLHCAMREDFMSESRLYVEEKRGGQLLGSMLPSYVIDVLRGRNGNWGGELVSFAEPCVSVMFVQICDFDKVTSSLSPAALVSLLDKLWALLDQLAERHGVTKLETIGKEYVAACGLNGERLDHASALVCMALDALTAVSLLQSTSELEIMLRVGINTGVAVAGIVGTTRPQFW